MANSKVTPSPLTVEEALEHPEVKDAIQYIDEIAGYVAVKLHEALLHLVVQSEQKLYLLLNRVAVDDPDRLAKLICNDMNEHLHTTMPSFSLAWSAVLEALRKHVDSVNCNLRVDEDGKILRK